jgi:hypothetical protein
MEIFIFSIVMLHLVVGFGWVLYNITTPPKKKTQE